MSSATIPQSMRAATIPKHGPASVIEISTLPTPKPGPSELLVKVEYAGVNFIDTYQRAGVYPNNTWPMILGNEGAGEVVQLPTDPKVLEDPDYKLRGYKIGSKVSVRTRGVQAEYVAAPWVNVNPLPTSVTTRTAASGATQGLTALTFLNEAYAPQPGDWILVHTAAGGLGLLLTQIATFLGAKVIGTTSSEEKAKIARENGAKEMIIYTKEDTVQRVLDITGGEGVHAVFDGVGRDTWDNNFKLIRRKGTIVSVGNASGVVPPFSPLKLGEKNVKVLRPVLYHYVTTPRESHKYSTELWNLITQDKLKIRVHKEYPFTAEGAQQAHDDIVGRGTVGKLIVKIA